MMKCITSTALTLALAILSGCGKMELAPRHQGRVVSHVDTYGSGTGGESMLTRNGSMTSGFNYGNQAKPDWTSDITWQFARQQGQADVYEAKWTFRPKIGAGATQVVEVPFDGMKSAMVFSNQWQIVSIEPGMMKTDSQQAPGTRR
jgi:hypothetical protein